MTVKVTKPAINVREKLAELDYGHVPYHKMPAGSVIQVVENSSVTTGFTTTSTSAVDTGISITISPKQANSKLIISFNCSSQSSVASHIGFYIYKGSSPVIASTWGNWAGGTGGVTQTSLVSVSENASTTAARTYKVFTKSHNGQTIYAPHSGTIISATVMEIAQ